MVGRLAVRAVALVDAVLLVDSGGHDRRPFGVPYRADAVVALFIAFIALLAGRAGQAELRD